MLVRLGDWGSGAVRDEAGRARGAESAGGEDHSVGKTHEAVVY